MSPGCLLDCRRRELVDKSSKLVYSPLAELVREGVPLDSLPIGPPILAEFLRIMSWNKAESMLGTSFFAFSSSKYLMYRSAGIGGEVESRVSKLIPLKNGWAFKCAKSRSLPGGPAPKRRLGSFYRSKLIMSTASGSSSFGKVRFRSLIFANTSKSTVPWKGVRPTLIS